jgi:hypothetical protein
VFPESVIPCSQADFPLQVSTTELDFGLGSRKAPVATEISQQLRITNPTKLKHHVAVFWEENSKYSLRFDPPSVTIRPESTATITAALTCHCTCNLDFSVQFIASPGGLAEFNSAAITHYELELPALIETQLSTFLDSEEIVLFTPAIGAGAFATVFHGRWRGQEVAVKVLKNQELLDVRQKEEFLNEVAMLERLRHPAIINFVGAVHVPFQLSIITEFCPFGNLWGAIQKYTFPYELKLKCLLNCVQGANYLATNSIIHRDIKPSNLLMVSLHSQTAVVCKLSDFGTTREMSRQAGWKEKLTTGVGTPSFMAVEVLNGQQYTIQADVFSFAVLAYQLYVERDPYDVPELNMSPWKVVEFVIQGNRLPEPKGCPPDYWSIVSTSWAQSPEHRPTFDKLQKAFEDMY